jgi:hypothetical protein
VQTGAPHLGESAETFGQPSRTGEEREWEARLRRNKLLALLLVLLVILGSISWALYRAAGDIGSTVTSQLGPTTNDVPASPMGRYRPVSAGLLSGRKPRVLVVSALQCDACAAERWAVVKALARFGTFSQLASDQNGSSVPSFNLGNAKYSSYFVGFVNRELKDVNGHPLDKLSRSQSKLFRRYDPEGRLPLVVLDRYVMAGSAVSADVLAGRTFKTVQSTLTSERRTAFSREINAEANLITAMVCQADRHQPSVFCNRAPIKRIASRLP